MKWLAGEFQLLPGSTQFSSLQVNFEDAERD